MSSRRGGGSGVGDGAAARQSSDDGDSVGPLPTTDVQRRAAARASARQKFRRAVHKVVAAKKVIKQAETQRRTVGAIPISKHGSLFALLVEDEDEEAAPSSSAASGAGGASSGGAQGGRRPPQASGSKGSRDRRLRLAAKFALDAIDGRSIQIRRRNKYLVPRILKSRWFYRYPLLLIVFIHCCLIIWEPVPANSPPADAFHRAVTFTELAFLCVYLIDIVMNYYAFGFIHFKDKKWDSVFVVIVALMIIDWTLCYGLKLYSIFRVSRPLRPFLLIIKKKTLRRMLAVVLRTFPKMVDVAGVFFTLLVLYSVAGAVLFNFVHVPDGPAGYLPANDNFNNTGHAALALYIFTTTENFPTVMYPALNSRPWITSIFFLSGIFFFLWMLVPLWLAIVYDHYRDVRQAAVHLEQVKEKKGLLIAYHILHDDGSARMRLHEFEEFVRAIPGKRFSATKVEMMFHELDSDGTGVISIAEFLHLRRVLDLRVRKLADVEEEEAAEEEMAALNAEMGGTGGDGRHLDSRGNAAAKAPLLPGPSARRSAAKRGPGCMKRFVLSWPFAVIVNIAILGTVVTALLWNVVNRLAFDACVNANGATHCWGTYMGKVYLTSAIFLLMSCGEMMAKVAAFGLCKVLHSPWDVIDLSIVIYCTAAQIALLFGVGAMVPMWIEELLQLNASIRVFRVISIVPRFRAVAATMLRIMRITIRISIIYISVTYMFAVVGMYVLADVPGDNNIEEQLIQGQIYSMRRFNDAMMCLLQLTVGNNWNSIMYPNIEPTLEQNHRWMALYFCAYFVICSTVLVNIVTGVIIEAFCLDREEAEKQEKAAAAVKQHQQAQLDRARQGSTNGRGGGGGGGGMLHAHPGEVQLSPRSLQRQRRKTQFIKTDSEKVIGRFGDSNSSGSNSNSNGGIRMNQAARGGADAFHEALIGSPMPGYQPPSMAQQTGSGAGSGAGAGAGSHAAMTRRDSSASIGSVSTVGTDDGTGFAIRTSASGRFKVERARDWEREWEADRGTGIEFGADELKALEVALEELESDIVARKKNALA